MPGRKPLPAAGDGPLFYVALVLIPALSSAIAAGRPTEHRARVRSLLVAVFSLAALQASRRARTSTRRGRPRPPALGARGAGLAEGVVRALRGDGAAAS